MLFEQGRHDDPREIRRQKNRFVTILVCIVLVLVGVGGIAIYKGTQKKEVPAAAPVQTEEQLNFAEYVHSISSASPEAEEAEEGVTDGEDTASTHTSTESAITATPAVTKAPELSLVMVGDDLLHVSVSNSGRQSDGSYNYDHMFRPIRKDVKKADIAIINQEALLAGTQYGISSYPKFNGRFEVGDAIAKAGFNVVLHATNHSLDKGAGGVRTCLERWRKSHPEVKVTGMYDSQKAQDQITYYKKDGICVAILNYTYGTNGIGMPSDMPYAVNLLSKERVKKDVKKAKKKADFIVVCPHWGTEYQTSVSAMQKEWSDYFLKLGVDLVIGSHPHVIGPVEWKKDKQGHKMLVYYSLGNYINSTVNRGRSAATQFCGGMAKVTLQRQEDGEVTIAEAGFVPLITHWPADGKLTTYKLSDYSEKLYGQSRVKQCDSTFTLKEIKKYFKEIVDEKFLENGFR